MTERIVVCCFILLMVIPVSGQNETTSPSATQPTPVKMTSREDHQRMMKLLNITSLRPGRNGMNRQAENYANYDESKANPFPILPDPLELKNGRKFTSAELWWQQRRPEIVEDFDREVYGRMPQNMPKVTWEIISTTEGTNGDIPIITRELVGHVDSHELIALCAPRPVFISSGDKGDGWVDARGMFLAAVGAEPVYRLLGKADMGTKEFPPVKTPLMDGDIAFRQHAGGRTDGPIWPTFLTFADRYLTGPKGTQ